MYEVIVTVVVPEEKLCICTVTCVHPPEPAHTKLFRIEMERYSAIEGCLEIFETNSVSFEQLVGTSEMGRLES